MKKLTIILACALLCTSVLLTSCGNNENKKAEDTKTAVESTVNADDTTEDTAADTNDTTDTEDTTAEPVETDESGYAAVSVASEDEIKNIDQTQDYAVDHFDEKTEKTTEGGDIVGIWYSAPLQMVLDTSKGDEEGNTLIYRATFSFRKDNTIKIVIGTGGTELEGKYELGSDGSITFTDIEGLNIPNAKYAISEDGNFMVFTSDTLSTNFQRIG